MTTETVKLKAENSAGSLILLMILLGPLGIVIWMISNRSIQRDNAKLLAAAANAPAGDLTDAV